MAAKYKDISPKFMEAIQNITNADRAFGVGNITLTTTIIENTIKLLEEIKAELQGE